MVKKRKSKKAKVILFRGRAGVGKTLLSNHVAQELGLSVIRKDDIYDALYDHSLEHSIRNDICELAIHNLVSSQLRNGVDVIVDTSWTYTNQIERFYETVAQEGGFLYSFLCHCSDKAIWKDRFSQRIDKPKPNNIITDFDQLLIHYDRIPLEPLPDEVLLDTSPEIGLLVRRVINEIGSRKNKS